MGYELYVITDSALGGGRPHEEIAQVALDGGVMQSSPTFFVKQHGLFYGSGRNEKT